MKYQSTFRVLAINPMLTLKEQKIKLLFLSYQKFNVSNDDFHEELKVRVRVIETCEDEIEVMPVLIERSSGMTMVQMQLIPISMSSER